MKSSRPPERGLVRRAIGIRGTRAAALCALLLGAAVTPGVSAPARATATTHIRSVLLVDYSASGGHAAGRRALREALQGLASEYRFQVRMTDDPADVTEEALSGAQLLIFSNGDGDVLPAGAQRAAVEKFVRQDGKGLLLVHAADAFLKDWKFLAEGAVQPYFRHGPSGARAEVFADTGVSGDANHGLRNPATRNLFQGLPRSAILAEDFYGFRASPRLTPGVNVLFSLNEAGLPAASPVRMGDHPVVWTRLMGNGVVVTQTLGHGRNFYGGPDSLGRKLLWNEMRYAVKDFVGCMDTASAAYNPEATVTALAPGDPADPCGAAIAVPIAAGASLLTTGVAVFPGMLRVSLALEGEHAIQVLDFSGKRVFAARVTGPRTGYEIPGLRAGNYLVRIQRAGRGIFSKKVLIY